MTCAKHCRHQPCPSPYQCLSTTDGVVEDGVPIQFIGPEPEPSSWPFIGIALIAVVSFLVWIVR